MADENEQAVWRIVFVRSRFAAMKTLAVIVLMLCVFSYHSFSQYKQDIGTLLNELKQEETDTGRIDLYSKLSFKYCTVNTDTALFYGNKAMELSVKINDARGIADANNNIGWAYSCRGDNALAKKYISTSLEQFKKIGDKSLIGIPLANLGNVYMGESNYPLALSFFSQAFNFFENAKDKFRAAEALFSIGRIYNLQKDPVKARNYFQQAYDIHKKLGDDLYMAQALSSIANTYQYEEKYDTALSYYKKTIPVFIKYNDFYRTGNVYENIAVAFDNKKQYQDALENMLRAEKYYKKINAKDDMAYAYKGLAGIYAEMEDTEQAISNYKMSLQLAAESSDKNLQQSVLAGLSDVYLKMNDYKNAYLQLDSSYKIKDSLFTQDKQDELLKLQTEFETERREKENEGLKTQNLASSLQLERNREWLIAAAAALLIAGIFLYTLFKNHKAKIKNIQSLKELNTKLEEQKEEISRINTTLELKALRAQMNPHFIFNCMSSIQECMLTGRMDDANTYLTKLSRLLRMVLNYSDEESISLDKELQMLTLYLQLEKVRLKNNFEFKIEMDEEIVPEELEVPALFLQPFAENAIWHGLVNKNADRQLTIKGIIKQDTLYFIVLDNGIGRKKAEELKSEAIRHPSKGISLVKKRLSIISKKAYNTQAGFTIHDLYNDEQIATGTCVEIELPLITI
ncbi:MAG: tetratricopeptide repeat protein [Parafilimonas sp.]